MGPSCDSAEILRVHNLRHCSYPFDWCQSGSIHHGEVFSLEPNEFYWRHIHNPSRILERFGREGLQPVESLYGYPWFFNPHRSAGLSKEYFLRCLTRFNNVINDSLKPKCFFLSARGDDGYYLLQDGKIVADVLENYAGDRVKGKWGILILITKKACDSELFSYRLRPLSQRSWVVYEEMPASFLEAWGSHRHGILFKTIIKQRQKFLTYVSSCILNFSE